MASLKFQTGARCLQLAASGKNQRYFKESIMTVTKSAIALLSDIDYLVENRDLLMRNASRQLRLFMGAGKSLRSSLSDGLR